MVNILVGIVMIVFIGRFVWLKLQPITVISPIVDNRQYNTSESTLGNSTAPSKVTNHEEVAIQIIEPKDWSTVTNNNIRLVGKTVSGADVFVQKKRFRVDDEGNFQVPQVLEVGINYIEVAVSDANGKLGKKEVIVRYEPDQDNRPEEKRSIFSSLAVITRRDGVSKPSMEFDVESNSRRFKVLLSPNTTFRNKFYGTPTLDDIRSGHMLAIYGKWIDTAHSMLQGLLVRDTSNESRYTVTGGSVLMISGNMWAIDSSTRGRQTVTIQQSTEFIDRQEESIIPSEIKTGHNVRIYGLLNPDKNTIIDVKEVKDYSLP